ncbi:MAG: hypothetical protein H0V30_02095 [Chitinophagaceae bacterium]|nr:hypothetical protein [Chitinophagaceae bacterium]
MLTASSFYKWLLISIGMIPLLAITYTDERSGIVSHPFYMAVTEINYNKKDKVFEVSARLFTDDFEKVLGDAYNTKVDLVNPNRVAMDKLIKDYFKNHLMMIVDDRAIELNYLGFEHDSEAVYCFLEVERIEDIKKLSIKNSILHDLNEHQINIMHVIVDGKRKSIKLNYPDKVANFKF